MDDLEIKANPEYLEVSPHLNKSTSDATMSINSKVIKEIPRVFTSVSLYLKSHGEFMQIHNSSNVEICSPEPNKTINDELLQQSINILEKYGDLKLSSCPIKMVIIIGKKLNSLA
jgi:hypothetical protein